MNTDIKTKIKKLALKLSGKYKFIKYGVKTKREWYGNTYGGFYLNPDLLHDESIVYSFGIGEDISFDQSVITSHNCKVFGFDPTPKSIQWIKRQDLSPKFHFYDFGISHRSGTLDFFLPKNPDHVSGSLAIQENIDTQNKISVEVKSLKDIMNELGHTKIDVLKMDIEGSEYDVIDNILDDDISINQILIEFHDRMFEDGTLKTKNTIQKMKEKGYEIFAFSDSFEEISFVNKKVL